MLIVPRAWLQGRRRKTGLTCTAGVSLTLGWQVRTKPPVGRHPPEARAVYPDMPPSPPTPGAWIREQVEVWGFTSGASGAISGISLIKWCLFVFLFFFNLIRQWVRQSLSSFYVSVFHLFQAFCSLAVYYKDFMANSESCKLETRIYKRCFIIIHKCKNVFFSTHVLLQLSHGCKLTIHI